MIDYLEISFGKLNHRLHHILFPIDQSLNININLRKESRR